ncbi:HAMP domain-containing protein [Rosenbergiella australiborealis]|uniref:HAMP domain-containing protein n=1 Tax=Rosenbergiella australiborealis TaxID=1544696 RepID=A0ABS5T797_9GAMM|nr:methyl-accepting chemotaxis protein [Rosenbergiella australiborealis]MBT0728249.1 HAMP domain-containing protein [Rosenbergiella australiborealis]
MLRKLKVVTSLLLILSIMGVIQIISSTLFLQMSKDNQAIFSQNQKLRIQQQSISDATSYLLEARSNINFGMIYSLQRSKDVGFEERIGKFLNSAEGNLQQADEEYKTFWNTFTDKEKEDTKLDAMARAFIDYRNGLNTLLELLRKGKVNEFMTTPVMDKQRVFDTKMDQWYERNEKQVEIGIDNSREQYEHALILTGVFILITLFVIFLAWVGIHRILLKPLHACIHHIQNVARGDLTQSIEIISKNEMGELLTTVQHMQDELKHTVGLVRDSSESIFSGASEIANGSNDLSARTEQQAASLEETASSMEQLTATVKQNAENARQASQLALNASETARHGGNVVDNVVTTMKDIADSSKKISDITSVIDGIAFQTNILALNAAVEAARAGEQGRGFAVVAGEVRNLAQRSAQAAKEIKILIEDSVNRIDSGSQLVENAGVTMGEIVNAVTRVTDIMGEIASASEEQSRGIDLVSTAVTEMDQVTQQNATLVEESATAAAALEEQAGLLKQAVAVFQVGHHSVSKSLAPVSKKHPLPSANTVSAGQMTNSNDWETF